MTRTPTKSQGVLVNLSRKPLRSIRVRIDQPWLWTNERSDGRFETFVSVVSLEQID